MSDESSLKMKIRRAHYVTLGILNPIDFFYFFVFYEKLKLKASSKDIARFPQKYQFS